MTVPSLTSPKLGAVNAVNMLEQRGKERFLENKFLLTVVDGRHRRWCIQGLASSGQPSTE